MKKATIEVGLSSLLIKEVLSYHIEAQKIRSLDNVLSYQTLFAEHNALSICLLQVGMLSSVIPYILFKIIICA